MVEPAEKTRRHQAILDLLEHQLIASQQALSRALKRRGFKVTQSTLSRDLKELRISRVPGENGYQYGQSIEGRGRRAGPISGRLRSVTAEEVTRVEANEVSVMVRTLPGRAEGVAAYLDARQHPNILGTIAGDDSILVLPRSIRQTSKLKRDLAALFGL